MYKKIKYGLLTVLAVSMVATSIVPADTALARIPCQDGYHGTPPNCVPNEPLPSGSCSERVFTFPAWYRGVVEYNATSASCEVVIEEITDFVKIPLNALEILIQAVAYAAVGFVLWGGFKYMKSQGDPGKISEAKTAIINAVTGLGIALASVAIVEFVQGRFV